MMDISKENFLPTITDATTFFDNMLSEIGQSKIKAVFSSEISFGDRDGHRIYHQYEPFYIVFENGKSLSVQYGAIGGLTLQYSTIPPEEMIRYERADIKDIFNNTIDICDPGNGKTVETVSISLEYDAIETVELKKRINPYIECNDECIVEMHPTPETFDEIVFHMKNQKTITVFPRDILNGNDALVYSMDSTEKTAVK